MRAIVSLTLRERWRLILWMALGVVVFAAYIVAVFPSLQSNADLTKAVDSMPRSMREMFRIQGNVYGDGATFTQVEMYSFMLPIMLLVVGIGGAASTIAGEQQRGRMDLLLSAPVSRTQLVLGRWLGIVIALAAICAAVGIALAVGSPIADLGLTTGNIAAMTLQSWLYAVWVSGVALAVACWTGSSGLAIGLASAEAAAGWIISSIAGMVDGFDGVAKVTDFHQYLDGAPLRNGVDAHGALLLALYSLVALTVACVGFARQDVRGG